LLKYHKSRSQAEKKIALRAKSVHLSLSFFSLSLRAFASSSSCIGTNHRQAIVMAPLDSIYYVNLHKGSVDLGISGDNEGPELQLAKFSCDLNLTPISPSVRPIPYLRASICRMAHVASLALFSQLRTSSDCVGRQNHRILYITSFTLSPSGTPRLQAKTLDTFFDSFGLFPSRGAVASCPSHISRTRSSVNNWSIQNAPTFDYTSDLRPSRRKPTLPSSNLSVCSVLDSSVITSKLTLLSLVDNSLDPATLNKRRSVRIPIDF